MLVKILNFVRTLVPVRALVHSTISGQKQESHLTYHNRFSSIFIGLLVNSILLLHNSVTRLFLVHFVFVATFNDSILFVFVYACLQACAKILFQSDIYWTEGGRVLVWEGVDFYISEYRDVRTL